MTSPSLGRLLISHITLRGPELRQLFDLVSEQPGGDYEGLLAQMTPDGVGGSAFGLKELPLDDALNFLLVTGLVEQRGASRRKASFRPTPLQPGAPFPLLLLHHMLSLPDERQRAPALIFRQLVADDTLATTQPALRERMERGQYRDLFAWTEVKINFWTQLASYLGLVRRLERSAEVLVVPQPALVLAALRLVAGDSDSAHQLDGLLRSIDERFFACFTGRGRVHGGLAQTLVALHRLRRIRLSHSADSARSLLLGAWRVSEVRLAAEGACT